MESSHALFFLTSVSSCAIEISWMLVRVCADGQSQNQKTGGTKAKKTHGQSGRTLLEPSEMGEWMCRDVGGAIPASNKQD